MNQTLQILGALMVLVAYGANQFGLLDRQSCRYLILNLAGSAILSVVALIGQQWGFLLLEVVWAVMSGWGLITRLRGS